MISNATDDDDDGGDDDNNYNNHNIRSSNHIHNDNDGSIVLKTKTAIVIRKPIVRIVIL